MGGKKNIASPFGQPKLDRKFIEVVMNLMTAYFEVYDT